MHFSISKVAEDGTVFVVDEEGNVEEAGTLADSGKPDQSNTNGMSADGNVENLSRLAVKFVEADDAQFDFDQVDEEADESVKKLYRGYPIGQSEEIHRTVYKAALKSKTDYIQAEIIDPDLDPAKLEFKTLSGRKIEHDPATMILTVKGLFTSAEEKVIASYPLDDSSYEIVGIFHATHLSGDRRPNVVIVPLNGSSGLDLEQITQEVFGPIGVTVNYETTAAIDIPDALLGDDGRLDCGGTDFLKNYTEEQQAVIDHVIAQLGDNYRSDAYYLFVGGPAPAQAIGGVMPLNRQFGWVFDGTGAEENKGSIDLTALHEIGHGVFTMEHPWSRYDVEGEGTTSWLMDYQGGQELAHMYWKQVYDPALRLYAFQGSEEGESEADPTYFCLQNEPLESYQKRCFATPDNQLISLEGYEITQLSFYAKEDDNTSIIGRLASFIADGKNLFSKTR